MSCDWYADVLEAHKALCPDAIGEKPEFPDKSVIEHCIHAMDEELSETITAIDVGDLIGVADGLADLIYSTVGAAIAFGIDLRPIWDEVHRSNIAKMGSGSRDDRKWLKPVGWTPPDIALILDHQRWQANQPDQSNV